MAHQLRENDSMISVGQTPWHGLGKTLDVAPASGAEALELAGLNWSVEKIPMFLEDGRRVEFRNVYEKHERISVPGAIVRQDTGDILGTVGGQYFPYQNADMAALFDPLIQEHQVTIETCGSLFNSRRVWMLAKFTGSAGDGTMTIQPGDDVKKYLLLAHGHDGSLAVRFGFTPIRVVCNNTLSFAISDERSSLVKCLHTKNLDDNLKTLRQAMVKADELFELTADQYRILCRRGVSEASLREYARLIVEAPEDATKRTAHQNRKIGEIVGCAKDGRGNKGRTWWDAYNGVTEWQTWTKGRTQEGRLNSVWFGADAAYASDALELAMDMSA